MDLPPEAPLASDLEWMLQSRRASHPMLADALLREYYPSLGRLAAGLLGSHQAGHEAALAAIADAVAQAHRYRSGIEIDAWFFGVTRKSLLKSERSYRQIQRQPQQLPADLAGKETAQKHALWSHLQSLAPDDRLLVLMQVVMGWDAVRIGRAARLPAARVSSRLALLIDRLAEGHPLPGDTLNQEAWLGAQIAGLLPAAELDEAGLEQAIQAVMDRSRGVTWLRGNSTAFNEVILLGFVLALVILVFYGANRLAAEPPDAAAPQDSPRRSAGGPLQPGQPTPTSRPTRRPQPTRTPSPSPSPTPEGIFYNGYAGQRYSSIASVLGVELAELRSLNRIPADKKFYDGQPLLIPGRLQAQVISVPTPVPPITFTRVLTVPQVGENVLDLLFTEPPTFSTLWLDTLVLARYGSQEPAVPQAWRVQFWYSMDKGLMISGPAGSSPSLVLLWTIDDTYVVRPKRGSLWFERFENIDEQELEVRPLMGVASVMGFLETGNPRFDFVSQESLLGREVWVVDEINSGNDMIRRRWVDTQTGLSLRMKNLGGQVFSVGSRTIEIPDEVAVQAVQYNPDFPPELFDPSLPWRGGYARDASGEPALNAAPPLAWVSFPQPGELKREPLPENFDLARSRLLMLNRFDASAPEPRTEIYADGYYLGQAPLHNPWRLWCQRSPDGLKLAYTEPTSWYSEFPVSLSGLFWLDLHHPEQAHSILPEQAVTSGSFAFSPDSRWLGFWACVPGTERCGVYVHDTETRENRLLWAQDAVMTAFTWSPDGELLSAASEGRQLFTLRLEDARLMHIANNYPIGEAAPPLSPVADWGLPFPPRMGDLSDCANPP